MRQLSVLKSLLADMWGIFLYACPMLFCVLLIQHSL